MFKKKPKVRIPSYLEKKIPYDRCYEELDIISVAGKYTRMYLVDDIDPLNVKDYDAMVAAMKMEELLKSMPKQISFQFIVHNRLVDRDKFLSKLLYDPRDKEEISDIIESYDNAVMENFGIGHNNVKKVLYFVASISADCADDAGKEFDELEKDLEEAFSHMYGIGIKRLSLIERLRVMYLMFNPSGENFGDIIKLSEKETDIDLENLKYMKLTTKDLVAPKSMNTAASFVDHGILNEKTSSPHYFRSFFLSLIPADISASFVSEITNISSNMIFSAIYEPIDEALGFKVAADTVKEDTVITKKIKRDTVGDRKNHTITTDEQLKRRTEDAYFTRQAAENFKNVISSSSKAYGCSFVITLYADDLELLDVDTELLNISCAKFDASVRTLDFMQDKGLMSCLPLGKSFVDALRVFDSKRLSKMLPIGIAEAVKKDGLFCGLNAINDTLILLNRKNNVNLSGMITGTEHSGKTYQMKRELVNSVMGNDDNISIISFTDEYDSLVKRLGGETCGFALPDIFEIEKGYGLLEDDLKCKEYFMDALITAINTGESTSDEEIDELGASIEAELGRFFDSYKKEPAENVSDYFMENKKFYPLMNRAIETLAKDYDKEIAGDRMKITLYKVSKDYEVLMLLDYLWNENIKDKKKGISNWIFIDQADDILKTVQGAEYFTKFLSDSSDLQTITTFTIKDSNLLFNHPSRTTYLENVVNACGYIKLLNQGPVERKKYEDILNIPEALIPYISSVSPGKGLIITPQSNIAFNDNFTEVYPEGGFKDIFYIPIKQRIRD